MHVAATHLGIALLCGSALIGAAQLGVNPKPPQPPQTGMIVGRVVDAASGEPISEAIVQLTPRGAAEIAPNARVMADGEGRFFFSALGPGEYHLYVTKDGHAPGAFRQRHPSGPSEYVTLAADERRTDIEVALWKYGVIGGTVVDEAGEPIVGVTVRALLKSVLAGRTRYGTNELTTGPLATTDDRGIFRLAQLVPGTYVVLVPSTQTTVPSAVLENPDASLRTELFWGGIQEMAPLGAPRTVQMGEFALMTLNRVLIPPPPAANGRMQVYRTTFYPAAPTAATATPITVRSGEERTDLTIAMRPVPTVRISGRLITPDGSVPPPMMIRLVGDAMADVTTFGSPSGPDDVGLETVSGLSDGSGRFMLLGVPAGDYVLQQSNRFLSRPLQQGKPSYWVSQRLTAGREDIIDVAVQLRPALRVSGRLEFRAEGTEKSYGRFLPGFYLQTPNGEPGQVAITADAEQLTFGSVAAGGQYIVRPYETGGWFMQSVTLDGKDITDRVFDLQADANSLVVTYTNRPSKLSGTVTDPQGAPASRAMVLAFAVDRQRWIGYGASPRHMRSAAAKSTGTYTFDHLPPGDYYVVAVDDSEADGWQEVARLEQLANAATRVSISASEPLKTVDLRVRSVR